MVSLPMRSYFHSATKKVLDHLRAWWRTHCQQLSGHQVMVQYLVKVTSRLLTMPTVISIPSPTLVGLTLFQVEYKTTIQSRPELSSSHLMRWRCFTWINLPLPPFIHVINSLSNRPQVSVVYKLINHAGCW